VGGKTETVEGKDFAFTEKKDTSAVSQAQLAGALKGAARSEWDYDGLMKWTLDLEPSPAKIEKLTLIIPLDNALMPLMHVCGDGGTTANFAGYTPPGEGRIWDGRKTAHVSMIGNYVPYIWAGAEERGVCVFGENDKGWINDPKGPCQEIVRQGDTLEVRLHLIAQETVIGQPRRIMIGFEATPVKPMPQDWRRFTAGMVRPALVRFHRRDCRLGRRHGLLRYLPARQGPQHLGVLQEGARDGQARPGVRTEMDRRVSHHERIRHEGLQEVARQHLRPDGSQASASDPLHRRPRLPCRHA
jgi:hypothetical protein